jgi:hypothetical protein
MAPVENFYSILEVVGRWAPTYPILLTPAELASHFIGSFWVGSLNAHISGQTSEQSRISILIALSKKDDHPGIFFYGFSHGTTYNIIIGRNVQPTDKPHINLISYFECLSAEDLSHCFHLLAQGSVEHYSQRVLDLILSMIVSLDDIADYCRIYNVDPPRFIQSRRFTEADVRNYLRRLVKRGDKPKPKGQIYSDVLSKIRISRPAFDKVWKEEVPSSWRKSGAPPKKTRSPR